MTDEYFNAPFLPLVSSTLENFEIQVDLDTWDRTEQSFKRLTDKRQHVVDKSQEALRTLTRKLELARASSEASHKSSHHREVSERIIELERQKLVLVKGINDVEQANASSQTVLERLKEELEQLDAQDAVQDAASRLVDSATILKLNFYRSLGISFVDEDDSDSSDNLTKAVVQSSSGVYALPLDRKLSSQFIANYLWDHM
jgi:kinetochore protein Spc24